MLQRCLRPGVLLAATLVVASMGTACSSGAPTTAAGVHNGVAAAAAPAAGSAAGAPATPTAEAVSDEVTHTVTNTVEGSGAERWLVTTVTPAPGYKCNMEYPRWQVQVDESAPVAAGSRVTREQAATFDENAVTFRVPVTDAAAAGDVTGKVRFSVCNDEACLMPTENVAWTLAAGQ